MFFGVEMVVFAWVYLFGVQGLYARWELQAVNQEILAKNAQLDGQIDRYHQKIEAWESNPFYKERYARKKLQMAYPDDEIYYIQ